MRIKIEISTAAYEKPYQTYAIYSNSSEELRLKWNRVEEGENTPTEYAVAVNKVTGIAEVKRKGEIKSTLIFDTAKETEGIFYTPYGNIAMKIKTEYINLPSVLSPCLTIGYKMDNVGGDFTENVFSVKLLLQK